AGDPEATGNHTPGSVVAVVVHVVGGTLYAVLGAFQFPTALRRQRRTWHRRMGRALVPLGLCAALSGLWLTLFYPLLHHHGALLAVIRLTFGSAMVASLVIAYTAIRRRDILRHRKWMIRAYALGLGVATQIFTLGFGEPVFGTGETSTALLIALGWVINLAVAEWAIRRSFRRPPARRTGLVPAQKRRQSAAPAVTGAALLDKGQ
ncbi:MAG: DUF2306 domain-containing protein, partial [Nocardioidaceae bacterium]